MWSNVWVKVGRWPVVFSCQIDLSLLVGKKLTSVPFFTKFLSIFVEVNWPCPFDSFWSFLYCWSSVDSSHGLWVVRAYGRSWKQVVKKSSNFLLVLFIAALTVLVDWISMTPRNSLFLTTKGDPGFLIRVSFIEINLGRVIILVILNLLIRILNLSMYLNIFSFSNFFSFSSLHMLLWYSYNLH